MKRSFLSGHFSLPESLRCSLELVSMCRGARGGKGMVYGLSAVSVVSFLISFARPLSTHGFFDFRVLGAAPGWG